MADTKIVQLRIYQHGFIRSSVTCGGGVSSSPLSGMQSLLSRSYMFYKQSMIQVSEDSGCAPFVSSDVPHVTERARAGKTRYDKVRGRSIRGRGRV